MGLANRQSRRRDHGHRGVINGSAKALSSGSRRLRPPAPHAIDEIGKAWIRAKWIEPGSPREPEEVAIPKPVSPFEPFERRIDLAESGVNGYEGDRRGLTSRAKLLEFAEEAPGVLCPAEPAVNMSQVRE